MRHAHHHCHSKHPGESPAPDSFLCLLIFRIFYYICILNLYKQYIYVSIHLLQVLSIDSIWIPPGIHVEWSMESMESSPWNEYGIHMGLGEFSDKAPFHMDSMDCSMESMESSPWNECGIHMRLGEFSDKVPFHMDSMELFMESMDCSIPFHMDSIVIVPILVILVEFEN